MNIPVEYVLGASRSALKDLHLKKLNISANLRKQLFALAQEWAERHAEALLIQWLDEHGEALIVAAAAPAADLASVELRGERNETRALKTEKESTRPAPPIRYEFWRSQRRHERRRGATA